MPKRFHSTFPKTFVQVPLHTDSYSEAVKRALSFNIVLEEFWKSALSIENKINNSYELIVQIAKQNNFTYIQKEDLISEQTSVQTFASRVNIAAALNDKDSKKAVLGAIEKPLINLSRARDKYFEFEEGSHNRKSDKQIKIWKNARIKAVRNLISVIGDKSVEALSREDMLEFRAWWINRINKEGLTANSANKEFGAIRKIVETTNDNYALNLQLQSLFKNLSLKEVEKNKRFPFETDYIENILLNREKMALNKEAFLLVCAMSDTGARPGELLGLTKEDIILDHDIPHIKIRPNKIRDLKTPYSERDIPLVGASLFAFKNLKDGFKDYIGNTNKASAVISKYCKENDIFKSKNYTLYSLRHSFEDRLTAVEPPDKIQAALMGHKYYRPRYGHGPSLEQKRDWLLKIAFTCKIRL